jgi:hypothetical protein
MFIEGERKRKGIGYRIVKIYRYEETLERINLRYNLRIHYKRFFWGGNYFQTNLVIFFYFFAQLTLYEFLFFLYPAYFFHLPTYAVVYNEEITDSDVRHPFHGPCVSVLHGPCLCLMMSTMTIGRTWTVLD